MFSYSLSVHRGKGLMRKHSFCHDIKMKCIYFSLEVNHYYAAVCFHFILNELGGVSHTSPWQIPLCQEKKKILKNQTDAQLVHFHLRDEWRPILCLFSIGFVLHGVQSHHLSIPEQAQGRRNEPYLCN